MRKIVTIGLHILFLVVFTGCTNFSSYQQSYKTLSVTKDTAVFLASTAKDLHFSGVIDDVKLAKIKDAYERVSKVQDLLIEAQIMALDAPEDQQLRMQTLTSVYVRTMTEFVTLAIEIGLIESGDTRIGNGLRPIPSM